MGRMRTRAPSMAAVDAEWQQRALSAAAASARKMIGGPMVAADTPVGKLSEAELGWLMSAAICAWISAKARESCAKGGLVLEEVEASIRDADWHGTSPWDAGAVEAVLPALGALPDVDWSKPLGEWPKEAMVRFLCAAGLLIQQAIEARDDGGPIARPQTPLNDAVAL